MEKTFSLPRYEILRVAGQSYIQVDEHLSCKVVAVDKRWGAKEGRHLWERFLEVKGEKQILAFTNRYGFLGLTLWNPFKPDESWLLKPEWSEALLTQENLRAAYSTQEVSRAKITNLVGCPDTFRRAMQQNPGSFFQCSLLMTLPEPISYWQWTQNAFGVFVGFFASLSVLLSERHGGAPSKKALSSIAQSAADKLAVGLTAFALMGGQRPNMTPEELLEEYRRTDLRARIIAATQIVSSFSQESFCRANLTILPMSDTRWEYTGEPVNLLHQIFLDFFSDIVSRHAGQIKLCDNNTGRKPCPIPVPWGKKFCSRRCKDAVAQRRHRARLKQAAAKVSANRP